MNKWIVAVLCVVGAFAAEGQTYRWTILAGQGYYGAGSTDGTNTDARFYNPSGIARDSAGNLYIGDMGNQTIRKAAQVGTNWVISTIAGTAGSRGLVDGTNARARFSEPQDLAIDASGTIYVADSGNNAIRKITPVGTNWVVTTLAGNGGSGAADGKNRFATFNLPNGIAVDSATNLYVTDFYNNTIRKVSPSGTNWLTTTIAGSASGSGAADGTNQSARFYGPNGVAVDSQGNLYVADFRNCLIRKLTPSGTNWVVTTVSGAPTQEGLTDGTNGVARFDYAMGVTVDAQDNLLVSDVVTLRSVQHLGGDWVVNSLRTANSVAYFLQVNSLVLDNSSGTIFFVTYDGYLVMAQPAFVLQAFVSGKQLSLTWSLGATNYDLQTSSTPADPSSWTQILAAPYVTNAAYRLDQPAVAPAAYYRLRSRN